MTTRNPAIVTLKESDDTTVVLSDRMQNLSPRTVSELIRALRIFDKVGEVQQQFHDLIDMLTDWLNSQDVQSASLAIRSKGLLFVVVQNGVAHDEQLSDALTELDSAIASDERFNLLRMNTLALPACSTESRKYTERAIAWGYNS